MTFFRRSNDFADPIPLDPELEGFVDRVATLKEFGWASHRRAVSDQDKGHMYLVRSVLGRPKQRGEYLPSSRAEEIIQINLVVLFDGQLGEYIQAEYAREEALHELVRDRFRLYGTWYDLQWLEGPAAREIIKRFFDDPETASRHWL